MRAEAAFSVHRALKSAQASQKPYLKLFLALTSWSRAVLSRVAISSCRRFRDVGDDIFLRVDEKGNILGFAILNATKRMEKVM
jgi:hypothetical protein